MSNIKAAVGGSMLKAYMTPQQRSSLGSLSTTHQNCLEKCKVARPGKTARDRAKQEGKYVQD